MRLIVLCLLLLTALPAPALAQLPKVLVINSYHADYPWVLEHNDVLRSELKREADLHFCYMDTKRLPRSSHSSVAELAYKDYLALKPDVVVLADDNALLWLGQRIVAHGTPVVYLGINNNPRKLMEHPELATGVLERPLFKRSILYIDELLGGKVKKCLVLFDASETALAITDLVYHGRKRAAFSHVVTEIQLTKTVFEWKQAVLDAKKNGYDIIIMGLYQSLWDENGTHVPDEEIARWTSRFSPVPVFAFWDFSIGKGLAVGGFALVGKYQGIEAAKLIRRVLRGEKPESISPVIAENGRLIFSRSELDRWRLTIPTFFRGLEEVIEFRD